MPRGVAAFHQIALSEDGYSSDASYADLVDLEAKQAAPEPRRFLLGQSPFQEESIGWHSSCSNEMFTRQNMYAQSQTSLCYGLTGSREEGMADHSPLQRMGSIPPTASRASLQESSVRSDPEVLSTVPPDGSAQLPSLGAALHEAGSCRPCLLAFTASGCKDGAQCDFCHFKHARKSMRPSKGKRERFKRLQERADSPERLVEHDEQS